MFMRYFYKQRDYANFLDLSAMLTIFKIQIQFATAISLPFPKAYIYLPKCRKYKKTLLLKTDICSICIYDICSSLKCRDKTY